MFTSYKRPDKIIDHSKIDIEEEINKFLKNGGKIQQGLQSGPYKNYEKGLKSFYSTKEWRQLKNKFVEHHKKQDTYKCNVCGRDEKLCVDHIKPVRFFWNLRLEEENLQILCSFCNINKGSDIHWNLEEARRFFSSQVEDYKRRAENKKLRDNLYIASTGLDSSGRDRLMHTYLQIRDELKNLNVSFEMNIVDFRYFIRDTFNYNFFNKKPKNLHEEIIKILSNKNNINTQYIEEQNSSV
jgi:5-methylcytosine-specific restriction endonuclease McrA